MTTGRSLGEHDRRSSRRATSSGSRRRPRPSRPWRLGRRRGPLGSRADLHRAVRQRRAVQHRRMFDVTLDELRNYNGWDEDYGGFPGRGGTVRIPPGAKFIDSAARRRRPAAERDDRRRPASADDGDHRAAIAARPPTRSRTATPRWSSPASSTSRSSSSTPPTRHAELAATSYTGRARSSSRPRPTAHGVDDHRRRLTGVCPATGPIGPVATDDRAFSRDRASGGSAGGASRRCLGGGCVERSHCRRQPV